MVKVAAHGRCKGVKGCFHMRGKDVAVATVGQT